MTGTHDDLWTTAEPIAAINPGPAEFAAAGRMAGERSAARLADHAKRHGVPSNNALLNYYNATITTACGKMRASGATETNLAEWAKAFVTALRAGCEKAAVALGYSPTRITLGKSTACDRTSASTSDTSRE
jgi:hypothetical protein